MSVGTTIGISVALAVLLVFSAFFSATETAFTGFSRARMKSFAQKKKSAQLVLKMSENYNNVLSTLLIGNNIVNILATSLATMLFTAHFGDLGVTLSTVIMTVLVLIFGEVSPKTIAKERPEEFAMFACRILFVFSILFKPLSILFDLWKKLLNKIFKLDKKRPTMTEDEFKIMVNDITDEGILHKDEQALIQNTMKYDDMTVSTAMIKSEKITYVDISQSVEAVTETFEKTNYSRVPVKRGGEIMGILYRTEFYEMLLKGGKDFTQIVKPAFYCQPTQKLSSLLKSMQKNRLQLALVKDGEQVTGLITVEDILEELVGEIQDMYDVVPNDGAQAV